MKSIISLIISVLPKNKWFFNKILGYKIDSKSRVGMFNIINCKSVDIVNAKIGMFNIIKTESLSLGNFTYINKFNRLKNLNKVELNEKSGIFSWNFIAGPNKNDISEGFKFEHQNLLVGENSAINRSNYFDVVREIVIGNNVVFGGNGSEIWTHGYDLERTLIAGSVSFGNNIFIGSKCVFTKDVNVSDNVTIGSASVVYKSILEQGIYSSHKLYKVK